MGDEQPKKKGSRTNKKKDETPKTKKKKRARDRKKKHQRNKSGNKLAILPLLPVLPRSRPRSVSDPGAFKEKLAEEKKKRKSNQKVGQFLLSALRLVVSSVPKAMSSQAS